MFKVFSTFSFSSDFWSVPGQLNHCNLSSGGRYLEQWREIFSTETLVPQMGVSLNGGTPKTPQNDAF